MKLCSSRLILLLAPHGVAGYAGARHREDYPNRRPFIVPIRRAWHDIVARIITGAGSELGSRSSSKTAAAPPETSEPIGGKAPAEDTTAVHAVVAPINPKLYDSCPSMSSAIRSVTLAAMIRNPSFTSVPANNVNELSAWRRPVPATQYASVAQARRNRASCSSQDRTDIVHIPTRAAVRQSSTRRRSGQLLSSRCLRRGNTASREEEAIAVTRSSAASRRLTCRRSRSGIQDVSSNSGTARSRRRRLRRRRGEAQRPFAKG